MLPFLNLLVELSPYFTALIMLPPPSGPAGLHWYFLTHLTLIGTFLLFELTLITVADFGKQPRAKSFPEKLVNFARFLLTATTTILALGMLSLFNERFSGVAFYALLALWPIKSLCFLFSERRKDLRVIIGLLVYSVGVSTLSFFVQVGVFQWQALVIGLAVGFVVTSHRLARLLYHESCASTLSAAPLADHRRCVRAYPICLILGPVLIGILPILGELSRAYMSTFGVVLLSVFPTRLLQSTQTGRSLRPSFLMITSGISLLFMGILLVARILS